MRVSGVLCCHNEMEYLPYSLASLYHADLDELIVVLDRCTDRTEEIAKCFRPQYPVEIKKKTWRDWRNPIAECNRYAFNFATGDIIFCLGADVIYDPVMFNKSLLALLFHEADMVGFRTVNRDLHTSLARTCYENFLAECFRKVDFAGHVWRGGIFAIKRQVYEKLGFHDVVSEVGQRQVEDLKNRLMEHGFLYRFVDSTRNLHLRDKSLTRESQLRQGQGRLAMNYPVWRVLAHSILHLKPHVVKGYLNCKGR